MFQIRVDEMLLLDYFEEENINEKVEPCCDICGVMLDYYQGSETNLLPIGKQRKLAGLFSGNFIN